MAARQRRASIGLTLGTLLAVGGLCALLCYVCGRGESAAGPRHEVTYALDQAQGLDWAGRSVYLTDDKNRRLLVEAEHPVLKATWVTPAEDSRRVLVLTAEDAARAQPRTSHLDLIDPSSGRSRRLSPEPGYNFWDVSAGDVDGDGSEEVALCTFSQTARDPRYARRFFVYSWDDGGDLYPRWRGSRLCRPYVAAWLADVTGDAKCELVSVETGLDGGQMVVAYEWNQFGFWGLGHSDEYRRVMHVEPQARDSAGHKAMRTLVIGEGGTPQSVVLTAQHGALRPDTERAGPANAEGVADQGRTGGYQ